MTHSLRLSFTTRLSGRCAEIIHNPLIPQASDVRGFPGIRHLELTLVPKCPIDVGRLAISAAHINFADGIHQAVALFPFHPSPRLWLLLRCLGVDLPRRRLGATPPKGFLPLR